MWLLELIFVPNPVKITSLPSGGSFQGVKLSWAWFSISLKSRSSMSDKYAHEWINSQHTWGNQMFYGYRETLSSFLVQHRQHSAIAKGYLQELWVVWSLSCGRWMRFLRCREKERPMVKWEDAGEKGNYQTRILELLGHCLRWLDLMRKGGRVAIFLQWDVCMHPIPRHTTWWSENYSYKWLQFWHRM